MLKVKVFTIFPESFPGVLGVSLPKRARDEGKWSLEVVNLRDYAQDKHKTVDEYPFGGGSGMLMKADVLGAALEAHLASTSERPLVLLTSARGEQFSQKKAHEWAGLSRPLFIFCGRFEGVDERFIEEYDVLEVRLGDFVLFGGEVAAQAMLEAVIRLLPGVCGGEGTLEEESYAVGTEFEDLMEYPQYTAPRMWKGRAVPEILFSGHHANIKKWRLEEARKITQKYRRSPQGKPPESA